MLMMATAKTLMKVMLALIAVGSTMAAAATTTTVTKSQTKQGVAHRLHQLIEHYAPQFNASRLGPCLDHHQYPLYRKFHLVEECSSLLEEVDRLGLGNIVKASVPHSSDVLCSRILRNFIRCASRMSPDIYALLTDTTRCFPSHPLIARSFSAQYLHVLIDNIKRGMCARDPSNSNLRCIESSFAQVKPEGSLDYLHLLEIVNHCDATLRSPYDHAMDQQVSPMPEDYKVDTYETDEPQQIHISFNNDNGMSVMFTTLVANRARILYGKTTALEQQSMDCTTSSYNNDIGPVGDITVVPTFHHVAVLTQLEANTTYYYQCVNGDKKSRVYAFTTQSPQHSSSPSRIAIIGDMGLYESQDTMKRIRQMHDDDQVSFYYHVGDISYADNWLIHNLVTFGYEKVWNTFLNVIQSFATTKPYMVLPGNHETECHEPLTCLRYAKLKKAFANYTAYNHRFHMPSNGASSMWYSFNYGLVHFISINTETDYPGAPNNNYTGLPVGGFGDQVHWLETDLQHAFDERSERPWIIVLGHRPIYRIKQGVQGPTGVAKSLQDWLEPLFDKYQVDLFVAGHVHSYERHAPVFKNQAFMDGSTKDYYDNPKHTAHIVIGTAGNEEMHSTLPSIKRPNWSVHVDYAHYGLGLLSILNETVLKWDFIDAQSGELFDTFTLDMSNVHAKYISSSHETSTRSLAGASDDDDEDDEDDGSATTTATTWLRGI